jgi:ABC-2 type transport system permease protein
MPGWLQVISRFNPLTYMVDALRSVMVVGGTSVTGLGLDLIVLLGATIVLIIIGAKLYPTIAY